MILPFAFIVMVERSAEHGAIRSLSFGSQGDISLELIDVLDAILGL
jgi:hypothetical protein